MKTILVINGEAYWPEFFPGYRVEQKKIQSTEWILKDGRLHVMDAQGVTVPDLILWRVGAIKPQASHRAALEIIRLSGVPCVNAAHVLLKGYDRLSMLHELRQSDLPVIPFQVAGSASQLKNLQADFPFVVKAGNYHGGFGKVLVQDEAHWQDVKDLLIMSDDYVTVEPYIPYRRDIRYLAVGTHVWAMARKGKYWKANIQTTDFVHVDTEPEWVEKTRRLQQQLGADVLAIDILEEKDGTRYVVEYNDIPGLSGFSDEAKTALANLAIALLT